MLLRQYTKYTIGFFANNPLRCNLLHTSVTTRKVHDDKTLLDPIVVTDDGSTIVCWHPEKEFPYEFTKPLPPLEQKQSSVLKRSLADAYKAFNKQPPEFVRQELMKLTYTTKHRWFPRSRDKKAKKTPMDRTYL